MAKKVKDTEKTTEDPATEVVTSTKPKRKAGKDLVPRLKTVEGASYVLVAAGGSKLIKTALLFALRPVEGEEGFLFIFEVPDGEEGTMIVSMPMELQQAQALYAGHARRVPKSELPPECPLDEVIDPPKKEKAPKKEE